MNLGRIIIIIIIIIIIFICSDKNTNYYAGFPGIQIGTHVNDWCLDDESLLPVFAVSKHQLLRKAST